MSRTGCGVSDIISIVLVGLTGAALFVRFVMRFGRPDEEELA